jgi:Ca2+-binding RTX toxin-like protein
MARIVGTENGDTLTGTSGHDRIFGLAGNDAIDGGPRSDFLDGGAGQDVVFGGEGKDTLVGSTEVPSEPGGDDDVLNGGSGRDWVTYHDLTESVTIDLSQQAASSTAQQDQLISIENAIGSSSGTTFIGDDANNVFIGIGDSSDFISSAGDDTYISDSGFVLISYIDDPAGIVLNGNRVQDGFGDTDRIFVDVRPQFIGSRFDDVMFGTKGSDWLDGADGADEIHGGKGSDLLNGGLGDDLIDGGRGSDWLLLESRDDAEQVVDLRAGTATVLGEVDTLLNIENVVSAGGTAGVGIDTLTGNDGANRLVSLGGDTVMTGGGGADRFQQQNGGFGNPDVITDFEKGTDQLNFTPDVAFNLDGESPFLPLGTLSENLFALGSAADADDLFIFDPLSGALSIDLDGNAGDAPIQLMALTNGVEIAASDIVIAPDVGTELFPSEDPAVASLEAFPPADTLLG